MMSAKFIATLNAAQLKAEVHRAGNTRLLFSLPAVMATGGQLVALVGANGAGKSTLLKHLASQPGLPVSGSISWSWSKVPASDHSEDNLPLAPPTISWLPQQLQVPANLTAVDVVLAGRYRHKAFWQPYDDADIALSMAALQALRLNHLAHQPMEQLSGGEQQLVWLAQLQLNDAPVVLLDEPMQHLDLYHKHQVLRWMQGQASSGKLVIFSCHDISLLQDCGARLVYIGPGSKEFTDDQTSIKVITELLLRPAHH